MVTPLLPAQDPALTDDPTIMEEEIVVRVAYHESNTFEDGSAVAVEEDGVLGKDVCQLQGPHAQLVFSAISRYRFLCLHILPTGFFTVALVVKTPKGHRRISLTNHSTLAIIDADGMRAKVPLQCKSLNWQMIPVDVASLTEAAFGLEYMHLEQVRVKSNCSVRKVFMSDRIYADAELPDYLKALE